MSLNDEPAQLVNGEYLTPLKACEKYDILPSTMHSRLCTQKLTLQEAVNKPVIHRNTRYSYMGIIRTVPEWSKVIGVKPLTLREHIRRSGSFSEALESLVMKRKFFYSGEEYPLHVWLAMSDMTTMEFMSQFAKGRKFEEIMFSKIRGRK